MKLQLSAAIAAATLLFGTQAALARPFVGGTVYRTTPNGVYLNTANGITYIPNNAATFQIGNTAVSLPRLTVGRRVNAYYNNTYTPTYVPTEYYNLHRDWDWDRHNNGWRKDRSRWHQRNGRWYR
ncbi:MAG: hypothetical protein KF760_28640 [Candidatus Eremiobacteraeota bacterium]|nr:hypothetical protein [Candidatus Eremiobacteraeota bacterium]MCW5865864.1 hypothetical protein [Candidatus Eremiobacteraeota bacterium]